MLVRFLVCKHLKQLLNSVGIKLAKSFCYRLSFELNLVSSLIQEINTREGCWQESVFNGSPVANTKSTTSEQFHQEDAPIVIVRYLPFKLLCRLFRSSLCSKLILSDGDLDQLSIVCYVVVLIKGVPKSPYIVQGGYDSHCTKRPILIFRHIINKGTTLHLIPVPVDQEAHIRKINTAVDE